jgi:hypothetical protein
MSATSYIAAAHLSQFGVGVDDGIPKRTDRGAEILFNIIQFDGRMDRQDCEIARLGRQSVPENCMPIILAAIIRL